MPQLRPVIHGRTARSHASRRPTPELRITPADPERRITPADPGARITRAGRGRRAPALRSCRPACQTRRAAFRGNVPAMTDRYACRPEKCGITPGASRRQTAVSRRSRGIGMRRHHEPSQPS
jgi:hypothetical protein